MKTALKRKERENPYPGIALPDQIREQTTQDKSKISNLILEYEKILFSDIDYGGIDIAENYIKSPIDILTPEEINSFLRMTVAYEEYKTGKNDKLNEDREYIIATSTFISRLIQHSFNAGHNDFEINLYGMKKMMGNAAHLKGRPDEYIRVKIIGDEIGSIGRCTEFCEIDAKGKVDSNIGYNSKNCIFKIDEINFLNCEQQNNNILEIGNAPGYWSISKVKGCKIYIGKTEIISDLVGAELNNFITDNKDTYKRLEEKLGFNNLFLIDNDDNIIKHVENF